MTTQSVPVRRLAAFTNLSHGFVAVGLRQRESQMPRYEALPFERVG